MNAVIESPFLLNALARERRTVLSDDGLYRLTLWREWSLEVRRYAVIIGLNPSTADAVLDDNTIRKCVMFSKSWGMDALCMMNLFALRTKDPGIMKAHPSPVGPANDAALVELAKGASIVVAAWGVDGEHLGRDAVVRKLLADAGVTVHCLGRTKAGHPRHPLYLRNDTPLELIEAT